MDRQYQGIQSTPNFCGRTRREFIWQAGAGFAGVALAGLLGEDFFARQTAAADGEAPPSQNHEPDGQAPRYFSDP